MLIRTRPADLTIWFDGQPVPARQGECIAVALLAAGVTATRTTPVSGAPRGPFCLMGACFECLAEVDGQPNVQTCMTPVRDGLRVRCQAGARTIATTPDPAEPLRDHPKPP